jgi:IstB-like ATP binding protein
MTIAAWLPGNMPDSSLAGLQRLASTRTFSPRTRCEAPKATLRRQKRFEARARTARLHRPASVEDIDYHAQRGLDRVLLLKLGGCDWIRQHRNVQTECAAWLEALPEPLRDGTTGEALQAIVDLDLDELAAIEPPRGYDRD